MFKVTQEQHNAIATAIANAQVPGGCSYSGGCVIAQLADIVDPSGTTRAAFQQQEGRTIQQLADRGLVTGPLAAFPVQLLDLLQKNWDGRGDINIFRKIEQVLTPGGLYPNLRYEDPTVHEQRARDELLKVFTTSTQVVEAALTQEQFDDVMLAIEHAKNPGGCSYPAGCVIAALAEITDQKLQPGQKPASPVLAEKPNQSVGGFCSFIYSFSSPKSELEGTPLGTFKAGFLTKLQRIWDGALHDQTKRNSLTGEAPRREEPVYVSSRRAKAAMVEFVVDNTVIIN